MQSRVWRHHVTWHMTTDVSDQTPRQATPSYLLPPPADSVVTLALSGNDQMQLALCHTFLHSDVLSNVVLLNNMFKFLFAEWKVYPPQLEGCLLLQDVVNSKQTYFCFTKWRGKDRVVHILCFWEKVCNKIIQSRWWLYPNLGTVLLVIVTSFGSKTNSVFEGSNYFVHLIFGCNILDN